MIQKNVEATTMLRVMLAAFERYKQDAHPSSALQENVASLEQEQAAGTHFLGYEYKEQLVAVTKYLLKEEAIYFSRLSVLPAYQRQGFAQAIIQALEHLAHSLQLPYLECHVRKSEPANIKLYTKLGFLITDEKLILKANGGNITTVTMRKPLM